MAVTLNSSQVQQNFGAALDRAARGDDVIVERYGTPRAAMIEYGRYRELVDAARALREARLAQTPATGAEPPGEIQEAAAPYRVERGVAPAQEPVIARQESAPPIGSARAAALPHRHAGRLLGELEAVLKSLPSLSAAEAASFAGEIAAARARLPQEEPRDPWAS